MPDLDLDDGPQQQPGRAVEDVAVLVNPQRDELVDDLLRGLDDAGVTHTTLDVPEADGLADAARRAAEAGHRIVAAVGGDGTQRTAAAALAGSGSALAVVPGGTVNLLGQVIGIEDVDDAVAAISGGRTRPLDVGDVDGEAFVLFATSGYDARVIEQVDEGAKRWGLLSYAVIGLRELHRGRPQQVTVTVDGEPGWAGRAMGVMVTNVAQRGSGDMRIVPDAEPDDRVLDVVIQRCDDVRSLSRAVVSLLRQGRPAPEDAIYLQGREVQVRWTQNVPVQRDGDPVERRSVIECSLRPDQVSVCCPADDEGDPPGT